MTIQKNKTTKIGFNLSLFYFFYFAMVGVYVIFMPKVLKDLGFNSVEIGAIYTSAPIMRFLVPFVFKKYFNLNNRVFFIFLVLTFLVTLLFFSTIHNFWLYLFINLVYGSVSGVILPFADIIALDKIGKERYGKIRLWGSIGFSAIALVLGKILDGYMMALIFLSLMALLTLITGLPLTKIDAKSNNSQSIADNKNFSLSKFWAFWISVFLFQLSFGGFYNFFTIYETSSGLELDIVSYLWIFGVACEIVMLIVQGRFLNQNRLLQLILISIIATTIRWLLVAFFPTNIPLLMLSQSIHALSFALYYSASIAYIYTLYSQKVLAQQFFLGIGFGLGGGVGALIAGVIYKFSPKGLFIFEAFIVVVAALMLMIHQKRKEAILND